MMLEKFNNVLQESKESILWRKAKSVGTTQIDFILKPRSDMCFFTCGKEDITGSEWVFTPPGIFHKGDMVEVIVKEKIFRNASWHIYPPVKVAIRLFKPDKYGKITKDDEEALSAMFKDPSNNKEPFCNRAFYRRFFEGARDNLCPFPDFED